MEAVSFLLNAQAGEGVFYPCEQGVHIAVIAVGPKAGAACARQIHGIHEHLGAVMAAP
jgi:hypothetical protein